MIPAPSLNFEAIDLTGQRRLRLRDVPRDSSVGELVDGLLGRMNLPRANSEGRPLSYFPLLERESRHLHNSEVVGEVLQENDRVVLHPSIEAGRGFAGGTASLV
ncbi:MAG: hypothetical protein FJ387_21455 [Verrucomicrobia bacterium]|nr:hypothetical protein [Verrucomicrobiota bacterium]